MSKVPVIGVTSRRGDAEWIAENTRHYLNVLREYGVTGIVLAPDTPVTLPDGSRYVPDAAGRLSDEILDQLDGLILAGGGDVDPSYFGAPLNGANPAAIDRKRDELELGLARRALEIDLPTFGICRGCQVMNVAAGGGMVQDFAGHRSSTEQPTLHDVVFDSKTRLGNLMGAVLPVNTYHHQGMDRASMAAVFKPAGTARPDDWLIEAFESDSHRWAVGVQWHPERLFELPAAHRKLWDDFVAVCK